MSLHLDGESMNEFGRAVARVCVEYPNVTLSDAREIETLIRCDEIDRPAVLQILARVIANSESTVIIGNGVATLIGMCEPVRIDGGPVQ
jgi:hypothetical protein